MLYGVADAGIAMLTAIVQFFLLLLYRHCPARPGFGGVSIDVGKLTWDAVNDLLFGYISDRTRSRWGRRRPTCFSWLFRLPSRPGSCSHFRPLTGVAAFLIVLTTYLLFDTLHSFIGVAYSALTPELTQDYDERTALTTVRQIFTVAGYIIGAALATVVADVYKNNFGFSNSASYSAMGLTFGIFAAIVILITGFSVKEKPAEEIETSKMPPIKSFVETLKNKPFVRLMLSFLVSNISFTLLTTLLPYYLKYVVKMEEQMPIVMMTLLLTIGLCLYPMKMIADRLGKGKAYALGLGITSVAILAGFFYPAHPTPLVYVTAIEPVWAVFTMGVSLEHDAGCH